MSITRGKFEEIKIKFGDYGSFAIWGNNSNDMSIFIDEKKLDETCEFINTNYIFLGINISKSIKGKLSNFHSGKNDYRLADAVQGSKEKKLSRTKYVGAYITDLYKDFEDKNSKNVFSYFTKRKCEEIEHFAILKDEIETLEVNDPIFIIVSKDKGMVNAFKRFCDYYGRCFRYFVINHYSGMGDPTKAINQTLIEASKIY